MLQPLGIAERPYQLYYHIKSESRAYAEAWLERHGMIPEETIIISPGSPRSKKKWHRQNYSILIDKVLSHTKMKVIILWGPEEYHDACAVLREPRRRCQLAPPMDFNQAAAFLEKCRLLICNDGGINHLSVALNVPSLAIFGNTSVAKWSPQGYFPQHYHLVNPEWKKQSDNRFGITPEAVFQKVLDIL
jgi:heptosyltransferase-2